MVGGTRASSIRQRLSNRTVQEFVVIAKDQVVAPVVFLLTLGASVTANLTILAAQPAGGGTVDQTSVIASSRLGNGSSNVGGQRGW